MAHIITPEDNILIVDYIDDSLQQLESYVQNIRTLSKEFRGLVEPYIHQETLIEDTTLLKIKQDILFNSRQLHSLELGRVYRAHSKITLDTPTKKKD